MKKAIIFSILIIGLIIWNNFFLVWIMSGTYISNNSKPILEGPNGIDTLVLNRDGTFESGWANGKWGVEKGGFKASYSYTFGKAGFSRSVYRPFFIGKPRISLFKDLNYYYKKVK